MTDTKKMTRDATIAQALTFATYQRLAVTLTVVSTLLRDALDLPIFGIDMRLEEWAHVGLSVLASRCEARARAFARLDYVSSDWDSHELTQISARLDALRSCISLFDATELAGDLEEVTALLDGACMAYRWQHRDDVTKRLTLAYAKGRADVVATLTDEELRSALTTAQAAALERPLPPSWEDVRWSRLAEHRVDDELATLCKHYDIDTLHDLSCVGFSTFAQLEGSSRKLAAEARAFLVGARFGGAW